MPSTHCESKYDSEYEEKMNEHEDGMTDDESDDMDSELSDDQVHLLLHMDILKIIHLFL